MSRIGVKSIAIPSGVTISVAGSMVAVKGPKGELKQELTKGFSVKVEGTSASVARPGDEREQRAFHGLYRALLNNMITGVSKGFQRNLEIEGVGFNARVEGKDKLILNIGFCHTVDLKVPEGLTVETPKPTQIHHQGCRPSKGRPVRGRRPQGSPARRPYKGKGIRYDNEVVVRKQGKAVGGKG
jgi:large subunit ribosomal protein L6